MYNTRYFINKFEAIPEERWIIKLQADGAGRHCALGFCNPKVDLVMGRHFKSYIGAFPGEYESISTIFEKISPSGRDGSWTVAAINNGDDFRYFQPTPKQRILAALRDIEKLESDELINSALITSEGEKELVTP